MRAILAARATMTLLTCILDCNCRSRAPKRSRDRSSCGTAVRCAALHRRLRFADRRHHRPTGHHQPPDSNRRCEDRLNQKCEDSRHYPVLFASSPARGLGRERAALVLLSESIASTFHSQSAAIIDPIKQDWLFSRCEVFIDGQLLSLIVAVIVDDENAPAD